MLKRAAFVFVALWVLGTLLGALASAPAGTSYTVECDDKYETCNF